MKYAHYDKNTNELLGWYDEEIHKTIPTPNIKVSDEDWSIALENNFNHVDGNKLIFKERTLTQDEINSQKIVEIDTRLKDIDFESVRPLRAINNGTSNKFDTDKLKALDDEASSLRAEKVKYVEPTA